MCAVQERHELAPMMNPLKSCTLELSFEFRKQGPKCMRRGEEIGKSEGPNEASCCPTPIPEARTRNPFPSIP